LKLQLEFFWLVTMSPSKGEIGERLHFILFYLISKVMACYNYKLV